MNGYIYMLEDKRNGKKYIGKHNGNNKKYFTGGLIPTKIVKKHGKEVFERTILENNITDGNILSEREKYYIAFYSTMENGYNLTSGGDGGGEWIYKKSKAEREALRELKSKKGMGRVISEESRKKMSKAHTGKILSPEHREKVIKNLFINRVVHHTEETKKKLSLMRIGSKVTEETKKKISKTLTGKKRPNMTKRLLENNPKSQPVSIEGVTYKTIRYAGEQLGMQEDTVRARINSKSSTFINWIRIKK